MKRWKSLLMRRVNRYPSCCKRHRHETHGCSRTICRAGSLEGGINRFVGAHFMIKHDPQVGGYFVEYEDGYESFSPAKAFEGGYTRL
jgi:hypothetical protein